MLFANKFEEEARALVALPFLSKELNKDLLVPMYEEVFNLQRGSNCPTCISVQRTAYTSLKNHFKVKEFEAMSKKTKYTIQGAEQIITAQFGVITSDNLTDEIAEYLLKSGDYNEIIVAKNEEKSK